jgi:hypothetical protein
VSRRTRRRELGLADDAPSVLFCGHCGQTPGEPDAAESRVCARCGMGLVLRASHGMAPGPDEPFLIVDGTLSVCAVSKKAEQLLEVSETQAIHRHVMDFLVPAVENDAPDDLLALLAAAAQGTSDSRETLVRPAAHQEVSYEARVGTCGPPPAALIVLDSA